MRENLMKMYKNKTAPGNLSGAVLLPVHIFIQKRNTLNRIILKVTYSK